MNFHEMGILANTILYLTTGKQLNVKIKVKVK